MQDHSPLRLFDDVGEDAQPRGSGLVGSVDVYVNVGAFVPLDVRRVDGSLHVGTVEVDGRLLVRDGACCVPGG